MSRSGFAHGGGVGDQQRIGRYQVHPVRVVQIPGGGPGLPGVTVLPDDAVGGGIDHADAVVEVVVEQDVTVGQRQGQRGLVESAHPPQQVAGGGELDDLAGVGVVHGQVPARVHLVGVGRIQHPGRVRGPRHGAAQGHLVCPVAVDLGDELVPVGHGERAVRAAEPAWRLVHAGVGGLADDAGQDVRGRRDDHYPAVLDVGRDDHARRGQHRVVRVEQVVGTGAGDARHAVPVDDLAGGDGYHRDDVVVFLRGDDVPAVGREKRVVWLQERLAGREVPGARELPPDAALRVDNQQPVVVVVGDEDVGGQHRRI